MSTPEPKMNEKTSLPVQIISIFYGVFAVILRLFTQKMRGTDKHRKGYGKSERMRTEKKIRLFSASFSHCNLFYSSQNGKWNCGSGKTANARLPRSKKSVLKCLTQKKVLSEHDDANSTGHFIFALLQRCFWMRMGFKNKVHGKRSEIPECKRGKTSWRERRRCEKTILWKSVNW